VELLGALRPADGKGWIGSWSPGIGDPTLVGWVTVGLYFVAACLCLLIARRQGARSRGSERLFWWGLCALLVLLGINKQLDLQTALTELGRSWSRNQGWYEYRHKVQRAFILAVGLCAIGAIGGLLFWMRRAPAPTHVAIVGASLLLAFVVIRASSFHHVDLFIGSRWWGMRKNWIIEIGGLLVVIAGAGWRFRRLLVNDA